jgi:hypothetical protein
MLGRLQSIALSFVGLGLPQDEDNRKGSSHCWIKGRKQGFLSPASSKEPQITRLLSRMLPMLGFQPSSRRIQVSFQASSQLSNRTSVQHCPVKWRARCSPVTMAFGHVCGLTLRPAQTPLLPGRPEFPGWIQMDGTYSWPER